MTTTPTPAKQRDSNLELYRIIAIFLIMAHHFFNCQPEAADSKEMFMTLFGMWGKTGINCFVLITGYFMCTSQISLRKFLKLLLTVEFWKLLFYFIFVASGYVDFSVKGFLLYMAPALSVANGFVSTYLMFFLTIPFLNILVRNMTRRQHLLLVILCVSIYTGFASIGLRVVMNYVSWFIVLYFIGSYIRLYPEAWFSNNKIWAGVLAVSLVLAIGSVFLIQELRLWETFKNVGKVWPRVQFFVTDSNKIFALTIGISSFMLFKNWKLPYNAFINKLASATFGVLLIHSNGDIMRVWLWGGVGQLTEQFKQTLSLPEFIGYAFATVTIVYAACAALELLRLRFCEKPILDWLERICFKCYKGLGARS